MEQFLKHFRISEIWVDFQNGGHTSQLDKNCVKYPDPLIDRYRRIMMTKVPDSSQQVGHMKSKSGMNECVANMSEYP